MWLPALFLLIPLSFIGYLVFSNKKEQSVFVAKKSKVERESVALESSSINLYKEHFMLLFGIKMIKEVETFLGFKLGDSKPFVLSRIKYLKFEEVQKDELERIFEQNIQGFLVGERITCRHQLFTDIQNIKFEFGKRNLLDSITIKTKYDTSYIVNLIKETFGEPSFYCDEFKCSPVWLIRDTENILISQYSNGEITYHYRFMYN